MKRYELYDRELLLERAMERVSKERNGQNRNEIGRFLKHLLNTNISHLRMVRYAYFLVQFSSWLGKSFSDASKSDIEIVVAQINTSDYTEKTKEDYKAMIKRFYKWLLGNEQNYPEQVKWIKVNSKRDSNVLPEDILTPEEISKLADCAESIMEKAFVTSLYESGARPEEFLTLQIRDLHFDSLGAVIIVRGKTGMRRIRLVSSQPLLSSWTEKHPCKQDIESPLWIDASGSQISLRGSYRLLASLAEKAGIRKKLTLYLFRHSRATELAGVLTEAQMCEFFGWVIGTKVARVYVHLSGRNLDYALLAASRRNQVQVLASTPCPFCRFILDRCRDVCVPIDYRWNVIVNALADEPTTQRTHLPSSLLRLSAFN